MQDRSPPCVSPGLRMEWPAEFIPNKQLHRGVDMEARQLSSLEYSRTFAHQTIRQFRYLKQGTSKPRPAVLVSRIPHRQPRLDGVVTPVPQSACLEPPFCGKRNHLHAEFRFICNSRKQSLTASFLTARQATEPRPTGDVLIK